MELPFKGFKDRPYAQDTAAFLQINWARIKPSLVNVSDLWLPQRTLQIMWFFGDRYSIDEFPRVVIYRGEKFLEDGTHRAVIMAYNGATQLMARKVILSPDYMPKML